MPAPTTATCFPSALMAPGSPGRPARPRGLTLDPRDEQCGDLPPLSSAAICSSVGRSWNRSAASRSRGRISTSPVVSRNTSGRPSTQCAARSMSACSRSGSYQVAAVSGRPSQRRQREALDRLQGDVSARRTRRPAPRNDSACGGLASGRSCKGREDGVEREAFQASAVHLGYRQAVPGDADEAHEAFLAGARSTASRAPSAPSAVFPLDHVDQVVQLDRVHPVDPEAVERAADLLARGAVGCARRSSWPRRRCPGCGAATSRCAARRRRSSRRRRCG